MSEHGRNQLCPAVPSVLTKTKSIPGYEDAPGRGKNHDVELGCRREFTLEASQQQPEELGRAGNILI